jgi:hypothetical protein
MNGRGMKHGTLRWNPGTKEWFCTSCGRTSRAADEHDAQVEIEQYDCTVPSVEGPISAPGTETIRLIRKPYKMTLRSERSGARFVAASTDSGTPFVRLELFHDTIAALKSFSVGFEVLNGTTPAQVKALLEVMNERIVGVILTAKEGGEK